MIAKYAAALAALLLVAPLTAEAQQAPKSRLNKILESGTLRVGTTGDFNPMSFRVPGNPELQGMDIEVAKELAKDMGVKVEFVPTEWKTFVTGITSDKYDISTSASYNLPRAKVTAFSEPFVEFGTVPLTLKKNLSKFTGWESIDKADTTVAVTLGTVFADQAKAYFKTAKIISVEAPARDYQEVLSGRAEISITSNVEAATLIKNYPQLAIVPVDKARSRRPGGFLVAQDDYVWLNFVNTWVRLKHAEGFFEAQTAKWLGAN